MLYFPALPFRGTDVYQGAIQTYQNTERPSHGDRNTHNSNDSNRRQQWTTTTTMNFNQLSGNRIRCPEPQTRTMKGVCRLKARTFVPHGTSTRSLTMYSGMDLRATTLLMSPAATPPISRFASTCPSQPEFRTLQGVARLAQVPWRHRAIRWVYCAAEVTARKVYCG